MHFRSSKKDERNHLLRSRSLHHRTQPQLSGTAGNSLAYHNTMNFSTKDRDNDKWRSNCAVSCSGAWWYNACYYSSLNGKYLREKRDQRGVTWDHFRGSLSLKFAEMKLRPSSQIENQSQDWLNLLIQYFFNVCFWGVHLRCFSYQLPVSLVKRNSAQSTCKILPASCHCTTLSNW